MQRRHSEVTETSGSRSEVLSPSTSPDLGPSHSDSGDDSTTIGIPSTTQQPVASPSPSSTSLLSDSPSSSASTFFSNKGAMAGLFAGLGILILSMFGIICLGWIRRRQRYSKSKQRESRGNASVTFSTIMRRFDANQGSEPRQTFSIQQTIPRYVSSHRISVPNVSGWWARRRERRSSQFPQFFYHSRPPSVIDDETKHFGEETRWTLGKVLEDQRQQVMTPLPPVPRLPTKIPKPARSITRALSPRTSRVRRRESEGGQFTLEDALLPYLSSSPAAYASSPAVYELSSSRSGRHPYAQA